MRTSETPVHPGSEMLGQRVTFKLKYSDQASTFNTVRHDESITGLAKVAYDGLLVVIAPGWRFGHTVPSQHVTLASPATRPLPRPIEGGDIR